MNYSRKAAVSLIQSWHGLNEKDGSHQKIIDIYNRASPLPRGTKMQSTWAWCAATWSAVGIELGYEDIWPIEMSCTNLIRIAKKLGIWVEDDSYIPSPGDAILYDWDDNGKVDCSGAPDHIGMVTYVNTSTGYMTVEEGNMRDKKDGVDKVGTRTVALNGRYIRGFITPKYSSDNAKVDTILKPGMSANAVAKDVIAGKYGNGQERKNTLEKLGYNYVEVQREVNKILNGKAELPANGPASNMEPTSRKVSATIKARSKRKPEKNWMEVTSEGGLYLRNGAGTAMKALCLMPYRTRVLWHGYFTEVNGVEWLYVIATIAGTTYTGFCSSKYLQ